MKKNTYFVNILTSIKDFLLIQRKKERKKERILLLKLPVITFRCRKYVYDNSPIMFCNKTTGTMMMLWPISLLQFTKVMETSSCPFGFR